MTHHRDTEPQRISFQKAKAEGTNKDLDGFGFYKSFPLWLCASVVSRPLALYTRSAQEKIVQKVAVVTGSSGGIGMLTALELARNGFRVAATMRNLGKRGQLDKLALEGGIKQNIDVRRLDVTDFPSIQPTIDAIVRDYGRIDVLVNNAGFALGGFAEDVELGELREQMETNFFAHTQVTRAVLPTMRQQRSGQIIMISSVSGVCAQVCVSSYSASKWALEGWSESLRMECLPLGIHVVLAEPGAFKTDVWDTNVHVAQKSFSGESPNRERARRFSEYVKNKVAKRDPQQVASLIARIVQDKNPKLRYLAGPDAHVQKWLKRMLPWKVYEKLIIREIGIDKD
jgi:NAD(P)-dependent dehydrogenase (short-subunit alcohol dehydrogenase family)